MSSMAAARTWAARNRSASNLARIAWAKSSPVTSTAFGFVAFGAVASGAGLLPDSGLLMVRILVAPQMQMTKHVILHCFEVTASKSKIHG